MRALVACDDSVLDDDVELRIWSSDGAEVHRSRDAAGQRLAAEARSWIDPAAEVVAETASATRGAVQVRVVEGPGARRVVHERCAVATVRGGRIAALEMYCGEPVPCGPPAGYIAPASLSDDDLGRLLAAQKNGDVRRYIGSRRYRRKSARIMSDGGDAADPITNFVFNTRWSDAEADRRIDDTIAWHRDRGRGFQWLVDGFDEPADLAARLERRGFVFAGEETAMAVRLTDVAAIPAAADVELRPIEDDDPHQQELALDIVVQAFGFTEERRQDMRRWWPERLRSVGNPFPRIHYLAHVAGRAVGFGSLSLCAGTAQLTGAAVLPDARRRGVYTTLLARRLTDAVEYGYHIASIGAAPGSRRVVERYGFRPFHRTLRYELPAPNGGAR